MDVSKKFDVIQHSTAKFRGNPFDVSACTGHTGTDPASCLKQLILG